MPATGVTNVVFAATVVNPSNTTGLVIWPADTNEVGRDMSYIAGKTLSNTIVTRLSSQGQIKAAPIAGTTDLLLDVQGWYQSVGTTTQTYEYNGDGLRTSKTDTAAGDVTHYAYDSTGSVPRLLTDRTTDYIYSPTGALLETAPTRGSPGARAFVLTDALGSTRALSDSTGAVTGTYKYSPYGTITTHTGRTNTALQYAGGYTDAETGLTYYINRYYSPSNGTFTTVDP